MTMWPDYGMPGAPNMDPYHVSDAQAAELAYQQQQAREDLASDLESTLGDYRKPFRELGLDDDDMRAVVASVALRKQEQR